MSKFKQLVETSLVNKLYYRSGNCINSFDEDGECISNLPYRDVTDFAQGEDNAKEISKEDFMSKTLSNQTDDLIKSRSIKYLHDEDNDVLMAYDKKRDVHHFFL